MNSDRLPWMPLYVDDFLGGTALWGGYERGLYALLLILQWASGPLPADPAKLAQVTGCDPKAFQASWKIIGAKFDSTPGGLIDQQLEELRAHSVALRAVRSKAGAAGADQLWKKNGKGNGKRNGKRVAKTMAKSIANSVAKSCPPSSSSSSSESSPPTQEVNCDKDRSKEDLTPSAAAIAEAMKNRCDILAEDLAAEFSKWARGKAGKFRNVDKAFVTWAGKHESSDEHRNRAAQADKAASKSRMQQLGLSVVGVNR